MKLCSSCTGRHVHTYVCSFEMDSLPNLSSSWWDGESVTAELMVHVGMFSGQQDNVRVKISLVPI